VGKINIMAQIQEAVFINCKKLDDSRFAPYAGDTVFIINDDILIFNDEIIEDFDVEYYLEIFDIKNTID
jgi:hypothetical protein